MLQPTLRLTVFTSLYLMCASLFPGKILMPAWAKHIMDLKNITGPGTFIFQSFENCDPPVTELDLWLTQRKFNRTTNVMDMTLSSPWPLSDDVIMEVKTATKRDGGYKPGSFYLKGPFCHTLKTLVGDLFEAILEATGVDECPIPGDIKVNDFYVDSDQLNDQILYGEYRAELNFFVAEQVKGCYMMYLNMVPKEDD